MSPASSKYPVKTSKPQVEDILGSLALEGRPFKLLLPDNYIYAPDYVVDPSRLKAGLYVGHVVVFAQPMLIISRIKLLTFSDEGLACKWPKRIVTTPIQHNWDTRKLSELPTDEFELTVTTLQCVLKRQDERTDLLAC